MSVPEHLKQIQDLCRSIHNNVREQVDLRAAINTLGEFALAAEESVLEADIVPAFLVVLKSRLYEREEALAWLEKLHGSRAALAALVEALKISGGETDSKFRLEAAKAMDRIGWKPGNLQETAWYLVAKQSWDAALQFELKAIPALSNAVLDYPEWDNDSPSAAQSIRQYCQSWSRSFDSRKALIVLAIDGGEDAQDLRRCAARALRDHGWQPDTNPSYDDPLWVRAVVRYRMDSYDGDGEPIDFGELGKHFKRHQLAGAYDELDPECSRWVTWQEQP